MPGRFAGAAAPTPHLIVNALDYLRIYSPYADVLGGLHWSADGDAVLGADGSTLALAAEIALFLEGFSGQSELPHFAHMLHVLRLLRWGPVGGHDELRLAAAAFKEARGQARNAGVLFAHLTAGLPRVPGGVDAVDVCRRLRGIHARPQAPAMRGVQLLPQVEAAEFERSLAQSLRAYSFADLKHWFRHGRGPVHEAAQAIVRELKPEAPRTLQGIIEELLKRGRLAGAQPFMEQMVSALTLPPRRLEPDSLPLGGYSGVGTRGHPDQILPGEFATDELEFLRRFAEHELLYYRREQPRKRLREETAVLIDQGVRTWGDVRLVLSAAALALAERSARKGAQLWLCATSNGGELLDVAKAPTEATAALVEASDLSENPAKALERVLEGSPAESPATARDIVILTHPRSLKGDVELASRRAPPHTRVFAVTVDGAGSVELSELRHGAPVRINAFKVDLARGAASPPAVTAAPESKDLPWTGSIEPLGFPFRFAAPHGPEQNEYGFSLAFDADGEWLFTASRGGLIHARKLDATLSEILPRGVWRHMTLERIDSLVGVAGGVCACGVIGQRIFIAFYDMAKRRCTMHAMQSFAGQSPARLFIANRALHCISAVMESGCCTLDLVTGRIAESASQDARLSQAWTDAARSGHPPPRLAVEDVLSMPGQRRPRSVIYEAAGHGAHGDGGAAVNVTPAFAYDRSSGGVLVRPTASDWQTPLLDGKPVFQDVFVLEAHGTAGFAAVHTARNGVNRLHVLRGKTLEHVHEIETGPAPGSFLLHDSKLAARKSDQSLNILDLANGLRVVPMPALAKCHNEIFFEVGDYALAVYGGKFTHVFRWHSGKLEATHKIGRITFSHDGRQMGAFSSDGHGIVATASHGRPPKPRLDPARFAKFASAPCGLSFVSDIYGQLFVLTPEDACVAAFFVYRATVAAWLPDGTRYGPASLTGGPTSPDALGRIGRALQAAVRQTQRGSEP